MKKIGIMTDSHSGILTEEAEKLGIKVLQMPFYIDDELYLEGVDLSREELPDAVVEEAEIEIKYEGYIKLQLEQINEFKKMELPKSREEFESRAQLLQFLNDMEEFLLIKRSFFKNKYNN